jgi:hypothetical protein
MCYITEVIKKILLLKILNLTPVPLKKKQFGLVLSPAKETGCQKHALTQWKMLYCKTVLNIITYNHVV